MSPRLAMHALIAALLAGALGCYDAAELISRVRNDAIRTRLEEFDLGEYRVTLPVEPGQTETKEVVIHLIGAAARYRIKELEAVCDQQRFQLRHDTLAAIRRVTEAELTEPDFGSLRARLLATVNDVLGDGMVEEVVFKDVHISRH